MALTLLEDGSTARAVRLGGDVPSLGVEPAPRHGPLVIFKIDFNGPPGAHQSTHHWRETVTRTKTVNI